MSAMHQPEVARGDVELITINVEQTGKTQPTRGGVGVVRVIRLLGGRGASGRLGHSWRSGPRRRGGWFGVFLLVGSGDVRRDIRTCVMARMLQPGEKLSDQRRDIGGKLVVYHVLR
jgi:hypothetical protein